MGSKMSNIHDGDEKIPTPLTLGRIRVKLTTTTTTTDWFLFIQTWKARSLNPWLIDWLTDAGQSCFCSILNIYFFSRFEYASTATTEKGNSSGSSTDVGTFRLQYDVAFVLQVQR